MPGRVRCIRRWSLPARLLVAALALAAAPQSAGMEGTTLRGDFQAALERGERQARWWRGGWVTFHGANLALNVHQGTSSGSNADRFDGRVGAARSVIALAGVLATPSPYVDARALYNATEGEADTTALNSMAHSTAAVERARRAPRAQLAGLLVNAATGGLIGIIDDRPRDGAISFALGMAVNTVQTCTQPRSMSRLVDRSSTTVRVFPLYQPRLDSESAVHGVGIAMTW